MFDGIKKLWKGIMRMFGYTTLKQIIGKDIALSNDMIDAINRWRQMLNGDADWISDSIVSLGIEDGICREFADCALVEMETSVSNERLDKIYQKNIASLNENLQEGLALGSFVRECHWENRLLNLFLPTRSSRSALGMTESRMISHF